MGYSIKLNEIIQWSLFPCYSCLFLNTLFPPLGLMTSLYYYFFSMDFTWISDFVTISGLLSNSISSWPSSWIISLSSCFFYFVKSLSSAPRSLYYYLPAIFCLDFTFLSGYYCWLTSFLEFLAVLAFLAFFLWENWLLLLAFFPFSKEVPGQIINCCFFWPSEVYGLCLPTLFSAMNIFPEPFIEDKC